MMPDENAPGLGESFFTNPAALLVLDPSVMPPHLRARSVRVDVVPLAASDIEGFGIQVRRSLSEADEALLDLLHDGETLSTAASRVGISTRTAQRRLAALRRDFDARTTTELLVRWKAMAQEWPTQDTDDAGADQSETK